MKHHLIVLFKLLHNSIIEATLTLKRPFAILTRFHLKSRLLRISMLFVHSITSRKLCLSLFLSFFKRDTHDTFKLVAKCGRKRVACLRRID